MRRQTWYAAAMGFVLLGAGGHAAPADKGDEELVRSQREKGLANWQKVYGDDAPATHETKNLLLFAPPQVTPPQLKNAGTALEAEFGLARKALKASGDELWSGKLAVYLFTERRMFQSFMRSVAKQRPEPEDLGVFSLRGNYPFIGASAGASRQGPGMETQAGQQLAAAVLAKVAGSSAPEWLVQGFGRATVWRAQPGVARAERAQARRLIQGGRTAMDVWNSTLRADEAGVLRASLAEYFAYGPGAARFRKLLDGFLPDEGSREDRKPPAEALKAAGLSAQNVAYAWRSWALGGR